MIRRNIIYLFNYDKINGTARAISDRLPNRWHFVKSIEDITELRSQVEEDIPLFVEDCKNVSYSTDTIFKSMSWHAGCYYETVYVPVALGEVGFIPISLSTMEVSSVVKSHFAQCDRLEMECTFTCA